jgi:hypothetical protein
MHMSSVPPYEAVRTFPNHTEMHGNFRTALIEPIKEVGSVLSRANSDSFRLNRGPLVALVLTSEVSSVNDRKKSVMAALNAGCDTRCLFGGFAPVLANESTSYANFEETSIWQSSSLLSTRINAFGRAFGINSSEWNTVMTNISWETVSSSRIVLWYETPYSPVVFQTVNVTRSSSQSIIISSDLKWSSKHTSFPDYSLFGCGGMFLLVLIVFTIYRRQTSFVHFGLMLSVLSAISYRIFINVKNPCKDVLLTLSNMTTTQASVDRFEEALMWAAGDSFVSSIELWTCLLMITLLFCRFRFRIWHLMFNFLLVFACIGAIGWLSLGDSTSDLNSIWQTYLNQFEMISSNWPSDLFVATKQTEFILWLLGNACIIFCGLYNFYQALLENEYSFDGWFFSWPNLQGLFTPLNAIKREIEKIARSRGDIISLEDLQNSLSEKDFAFLDKTGCIHRSLVLRQRRERRDHTGYRLSALLARSEGVYNWMCMNFPRGNQTSAEFITDEDMKEAVEKSFAEYQRPTDIL